MFMISSRDGQIYTTDLSSRKKDGRTYLAKVSTDGGVFTSFEKLNVSPRFGSQAHPCIALDGSYIIFDVDGGAYMYVSFKNPHGTWREAIDLTKHGFDPLAGGPSISPDGKYLFVALNGNIWWVDIKVIENLRPKA
jgi:Tol biopolymer transport system component